MHRTHTSTATPLARLLALSTATAAALLLVLAGPALAHAGDDSHSHSDDDIDYADPIVWDGVSTVDCAATGEGTILWTLTGSDDVTYAELHIDEPVRSVTSRNAPPFIWVSPFYALDTIDADVDRIVGELAADAQLVVVHCPEGGAADGAGLALPVGGSLIVGALLGLLVGSRRRSTPSAA